MNPTLKGWEVALLARSLDKLRVVQHQIAQEQNLRLKNQVLGNFRPRHRMGKTYKYIFTNQEYFKAENEVLGNFRPRQTYKYI